MGNWYFQGNSIEFMLTGPELLAKVKELGDVSKSELLRECGYVSTKKDGSERLNFTAFYEALLGAKGVNLGGNSLENQSEWFIETTCVTYITRIISSPEEITPGLVESLIDEFNTNPLWSPFCNQGDYDIDDLKSDLPPGWILSEDEKLPIGSGRISIVALDYEASNTFELRGNQGKVIAYDLGFVQPISFEPALDDIKTDIWCPWSGKDADGILFLFNDPLEGLCAADCDIDDYAKALSLWKSQWPNQRTR